MKTALGIFLLLNLSACTEVQVVLPNPRIEVPELRGNRGLKISLDGEGSHNFRVTGNGSSRPPDMNSPALFHGAAVTPGFLFSPAAPVELGVEVLPLGLGVAAVAKWQVWGAGTREAEEGNFPITLYVRTGSGYGQQSGDQKQIFGPGGFSWKGSVNAAFVHTGVSAGYRVANSALLYAGAAVGQYWIRAEVDQNAGVGDAGGVYKTSYPGFGSSEGLGVLFNWRVVQFFVGGEYTHLQYTQVSPLDDIYFHGGLYITPK